MGFVEDYHGFHLIGGYLKFVVDYLRHHPISILCVSTFRAHAPSILFMWLEKPLHCISLDYLIKQEDFYPLHGLD
jgi:hypothetical protein